MLIMACLIVAFHIGLGVACLLERPRRKKWDQEKVVHLPFFLAAVGIVCGTILSIPTIVCAIDRDWLFAFFGGFVLLCDCMMIAYKNCVIRYDAKGFTAKNFFGISRSCSYGEVESLRTGRDSRIYFRGHSVLIDEMSRGRIAFIEAVDKGYKRETGKWVPAHPRKWDPMNGNVDHPWLYFILWVAIGLGCIAVPVIMFLSMNTPTDPADISVHTVRFHSYAVEEDALLLYGEGEAFYKISYFQHYGQTLPAPEVLCNGETYRVGVRKDSPYIKTLTAADGTQCITLESELQAYRESQKNAVWLVLAMCLAGLPVSCLGIAVARHPERYSDRLRRLFYKDDCFI